MSKDSRFQIDILNENMEKIGTASRDVAHYLGLWHQTFHCWIVRQDDEDFFILFQRRGPQKKLYPNLLDVTVAGHLKAGEGPRDGVREIKEEIGKKVNFKKLISLGIRTEVVKIGDIINREFCHVFLWHNDAPLESYTLQPDEVAGLFQVRVMDGLRLFSGEVTQIPATGYQIENQHRKQVHLWISTMDIVPRKDKYYLNIFLVAYLYFQGFPVRYLSI